MSPQSAEVRVEARVDDKAVAMVLELAKRGVINDEALGRRLLERCVEVRIGERLWERLDEVRA